MIDKLVSSPVIEMLEQTLSFTEQRHQVLVEDIANGSTPGFVQKDMSVAEFQGALRDAVQKQRSSTNDAYRPESDDTIDFCGASRVAARPTEAPTGVAYHDRGVRSMEYLMS